MPDTHSRRNTVALTGATGFIGRHLQQAFLDAGYTVRALVRSASSSSPALLEGVEVAVVDLRSQRSLAAAVDDAATIVYGAGTVRGRTLEDFRLANVEGVRAMVTALARARSDTPLLLLSSLAASAPELSFYAASKSAGEQVVRDSNLSHWSIVRPPAVYGPGDKELRATFGTIRRGVVPLIAPPEQRLPFIEVSDLARAIVAWARNPEPCAGGTFAIHDGTPGGYDWNAIQRLLAPPRALRIPVPYTLLEMLGHVNLSVSKIAGYAPMLTPGKVRELTFLNWACSNEAFTAATGWRPKVTLAEGVAQLFAQ